MQLKCENLPKSADCNVSLSTELGDVSSSDDKKKREITLDSLHRFWLFKIIYFVLPLSEVGVTSVFIPQSH